MENQMEKKMENEIEYKGCMRMYIWTYEDTYRVQGLGWE